MSTKGKKIETWRLRHNEQTANVSVYLHNAHSAHPYFVVSCANPEIEEEGRDLGKLREKAQSIVDKAFEVEWTRKIHVTLRAPIERARYEKHYDGRTNRSEWHMNAEMGVTAESYEIATIGRQTVHRLTGTGPYRTYELPVGDMPHDDVTWADPNRASTNALIEDTPENREALLRIQQALESAADGLRKLLAPAQIEGTLKKVLSAPSFLALGGGDWRAQRRKDEDEP